MIYKFDVATIFKFIIKRILNIKLLSITIYTNSKFLYNYLIK